VLLPLLSSVNLAVGIALSYHGLIAGPGPGSKLKPLLKLLLGLQLGLGASVGPGLLLIL
jgi:hypothetical protein